MIIENVYDRNPVKVCNTDTLADAANLCIETRCSDLMITDSEGNFVGVCSEGDLIRKCMPKYSELMEEGLTLEDAFDIFVEKGKNVAGESVMSIAITNPITVTPNTNIQKAASYMVSKNIRRLPVVSGGKLVGTISRGEVAKQILAC